MKVNNASELKEGRAADSRRQPLLEEVVRRIIAAESLSEALPRSYVVFLCHRFIRDPMVRMAYCTR